ncbi:SAM-dependent methyltransferase [Sinorhizobium medicae]
MSAMQTAADSHAHLMDRMYRHQRYIYDFTRKYYLFGRDTLLRELTPAPGASILEVGCGTGRNLAMIGDLYPGVRLFGLDISAEMLAAAKTKLRRQGRPDSFLRVADATDFTAASFGQNGFDRIVISYALSMVPDWGKGDRCRDRRAKPGRLAAYCRLRPAGRLARRVPPLASGMARTFPCHTARIAFRRDAQKSPDERILARGQIVRQGLCLARSLSPARSMLPLILFDDPQKAEML